MNKIYRKVWSSKLGAYIAVSEVAKSKTKCGGLVSGAVMCLSLAGTNAFAQVTTNWATWNLPSSYSLPSVGLTSTSFKYAAGATGSVVDPLSGNTIGLTLSGEANQYSGNWYNGGYLNTAYTSSSFVARNPSVAGNSAMISQTGYTLDQYKAHTITFDRPVTNVLMAVTSLGGQGMSSLQFTTPFSILSSNNPSTGAVDVLWYGASTTQPSRGTAATISASSTPFLGDSSTGYFLSGYEGAGVIQFWGTYSSLSWTVTDPEFYSGFTVGFTSLPATTTATLPATYSFPAGTLPPAFTASIRPINASNDVVTGLDTVTSRVFDGGTLVLSGSLDSTKNFTITSNGGSMSVASVSDIFTASGTIADDASSIGSFKKLGAGRLVLSANNTYTGGTTIEAGVLQVSANSNLGTGSLTLKGGTLATTETINTTREVAVESSGTLDVASGKDLTLSGVVSGTGALTKTSAGRLILSGSNTQTGTLNVNAGTLVLNGSTTSSTLNVASGAVLTGSGSTAGAVALTGTVKPGNSPGTLSVAGNFTMAANSVLEAEIDGRTYSAAGGAGSYDRIALTGASSVFTANGTVAPLLRGISAPANNTFSPVVGDAFRVVTTANAAGVDTVGAFTAVTDPTAANGMPANSRFDVVYGSNFIDLVLTPKSLEEFAKPYGIQNMVNAARAFDGIRPAQGARGTSNTQQLFNGLYGLGADALSRSVLQASGEIHAFALSEARQGWQSATRAIASVAGIKAERNLWVDASGEKLSYKQDGYASAYTSNKTDLWIGSHVLEHKDVQVGVAAGLSTRNLNGQVAGTAQLDTQALAVYANGRKAEFDYSAVFSVNRSNIDTSRQTSLSTGSLSNTSDSSAQGAVLSLSAGMTYALNDKINGRVWINGLMDQTRSQALSEQGSAVTALGVARESFSSSQVTLGYTLSGRINVPDNRPGTWTLGAGVTHQADQGRPQVSRQMSLHGANWQVTAPKLGSMTQFLQGGVRVPVAANADVWINLGASERKGASASGGNVGLSIRW